MSTQYNLTRKANSALHRTEALSASFHPVLLPYNLQFLLVRIGSSTQGLEVGKEQSTVEGRRKDEEERRSRRQRGEIVQEQGNDESGTEPYKMSEEEIETGRREEGGGNEGAREGGRETEGETNIVFFSGVSTNCEEAACQLYWSGSGCLAQA